MRRGGGFLFCSGSILAERKGRFCGLVGKNNDSSVRVRFSQETQLFILQQMVIEGVIVSRGKGIAARWYLIDNMHTSENH